MISWISLREHNWYEGTKFTLIRAMGFPTEFFTVLFAIPRMAGYLAHWRESLDDPDTKIMRPQQVNFPVFLFSPLICLCLCARACLCIDIWVWFKLQMVYHPIIFYWINILKFHHWIYIFSMLLTHIPNFMPRERDGERERFWFF